MIDKLHKLKQQQINQQLLLKQQAAHSISDIDNEIDETNRRLHGATLDIMGAISDFRVLQIHKDTMKEHIIKLSQKKQLLMQEVERINKIIVELNKESEQFDYIIGLQKKQKAKELLKKEEEVAAEYMQAKFIAQGIASV